MYEKTIKNEHRAWSVRIKLGIVFQNYHSLAIKKKEFQVKCCRIKWKYWKGESKMCLIVNNFRQMYLHKTLTGVKYFLKKFKNEILIINKNVTN